MPHRSFRFDNRWPEDTPYQRRRYGGSRQITLAARETGAQHRTIVHGLGQLLRILFCSFSPARPLFCRIDDLGQRAIMQIISELHSNMWIAHYIAYPALALRKRNSCLEHRSDHTQYYRVAECPTPAPWTFACARQRIRECPIERNRTVGLGCPWQGCGRTSPPSARL